MWTFAEDELKMAGILGANGYVGEMTEMKKNLEAMIQSDQRYRGCQVKVAETPEEFRVMLSHQDQFNKGTLAEALFRKHEHDDEPIDFGLSIGDRQMDEPMHQAMRAHGYHAIVVKGKDGNNFDPWPTYASHRLQHYRESIDILEKLAGTRNQINELMHRVLQSLGRIGKKSRYLIMLPVFV